MTPSFRTENDFLGEVKIPVDALWGAATQRAIENFPISCLKFPIPFIKALALVKQFAAEVNCELGLLDKKYAGAIATSAQEIWEEAHADHFPLDIFQTGSGTSTNMNANEVIANLANIRLGGRAGIYEPVHPNDHVNMGQSSNDVMPSALHIAAAAETNERLLPAILKLKDSLGKKAAQFKDVLKIGRTHLQDALPMTLGQEFGGWARQIEKGAGHLKRTLSMFSELALGGTAVGTGAGTHHDFAGRVCKKLSAKLGADFRPAENLFEAISSRIGSVQISGVIKVLAISLTRIAEDIKLLASGPRLGLCEIQLPPLQPGSSIMPGKINPVIPEMVCQVGTLVTANDTAITTAASAGHLELNTQLPIIIYSLLSSIEVLANATRVFADKCIEEIGANEEWCRKNVDRSLAIATALVPKIGYDRAAVIAREAQQTGKTIREITKEKQIASDEEIDKLINPQTLAHISDK